VSVDDWILALHLLAAFAFVGALLGFWAMIVAGWNVEQPSGVRAIFRLNPILGAVVGVGAIGTLVFGIWLAISLEAFQIWDGWVIAALVLWAVSGAAGQRAGVEYARAESRARDLLESGSDGPSQELAALVRTRRGLAMHSIATVAAVLILIDMIWKPGA
jgi:hypothetical protein